MKPAQATQLFEVKDARDPLFAKFDIQVHDTFAPVVGQEAWCVYTSLCRYAGFTSKQCFPSYELLARIWGVHYRTIQRCMTRLIKANLVTVKKTGRVPVYTITDPFSGVDKNVQSDRPKISSLAGQKCPPELDPGKELHLKKGPARSGSDFRTHKMNPSGGGSGKASPPRYTQNDFDERDFRKWRRAMDLYEKTSPASVGSNSDAYINEYIEGVQADAECKTCKGGGYLSKKRFDESKGIPTKICECVRPRRVLNPEYAAKLKREDDQWIRNAKRAAADCGLLPRRLVQLLKQIYPDDPKIDRIK